MGDSDSNNKYIPLKTAAELYGYTRDHLGLMIRQNKLKGLKLGSYYVTTNGWMTDYIKNFADPSHPISRSKLSNKFLTEILSSKKELSLAASAENTIRKPVKTIAPKNTQNNASKEDAVDNNLKEKILKELAQYKSLIDGKAPKADINQTESIVSTFSNAPYVILPVRKMENAEREEIFKKAE
ncbi:MAG: hypothetical protein Q8N43_00600 [Candidatus Azambacteria bacterium]|nr:hypothetical protein [Candidatus Azambacteria bacterium]